MQFDLTTLTLFGVGIFSLILIRAGVRLVMGQRINQQSNGQKSDSENPLFRYDLNATVLGITLITIGFEIFMMGILAFQISNITYFIFGWLILFLTVLIGIIISKIIGRQNPR